MSLTSLLKDKNSWVSKFISKEMPGIGKYASHLTNRFKAPLVVRAPNKYSFEGQQYALAGTAFDNMVRLAHGESPWDLPMLIHGVWNVGWNHEPIALDEQKYYPPIMSLYATIEEADYKDNNWSMAEMALFTAYLVHEGRGPMFFQGPSPFNKAFPFFDRGVIRGYPFHWNDISDDLPFPILQDLVNLYKRFTPYAEKLRMEEKGNFGPTFNGSLDVGGADADFISSDGCILDFKVVNRPKFADELQQALGYVLSDYRDEYKINRLSWYYARHGKFVNVRLKDILSEVTHPGTSLEDLRSKFMETARSNVEDSTNSDPNETDLDMKTRYMAWIAKSFHGCWTDVFWPTAKDQYEQVTCKGCGHRLYLEPDRVQPPGICRCMWPDGPTASSLK